MATSRSFMREEFDDVVANDVIALAVFTGIASLVDTPNPLLLLKVTDKSFHFRSIDGADEDEVHTTAFTLDDDTALEMHKQHRLHWLSSSELATFLPKLLKNKEK